ncbi:class I SAM-dependent DNA methyltransferase [Sulfitobacter donghicola]|uniref:Type 11 methyltransferase n=1 Tax=Sulfitobacter donghicola DSW-25 = KCTC 12864 = JCM 14565 TaxID=1300350 RepID=A0A073ISK5_9RHOB|nr:methyltransferase domain-containing protein [Sulfitobacter donghicola]KEJ88382.1 type 11 methyltransferase [Sulfitobacter donghicola DSW-25 = KCTC 12864 = JCM 14565]KIN69754.1 Methyltransferase-like protein [Sulfitobacter donghicola DSW-25 = KCTC 12864 = JCM 14565]
MTETFLDKAYTARDTDSTRQLYDDWSASYEVEIGENGYATPKRCAEALAEFAPDKSLPLLDFGCGTGLAGLALRNAGFETIDGVDLSSEMINQAKSKNIYRTLTQIEPDTDIGENHMLMSAVGVIGAGAAPISTLDKLLHALPSKGLLVFSFNDHALAESENIGRLNEWLDCGAAVLLFSEYGDHLPGQGINSTVYVVEKA